MIETDPHARIRLIVPTDDDRLAATKTLFQEYADWLNVDLCFQGFDAEMAEFPAHYCALRLALVNDRPAGAVALRRLDDDVCEMKRLFCRDDYRGLGVGRRLARAIIGEARRQGFTAMRLDTLARLTAARRLYADLGFYPIPPYYHNPLDEVVFLQCDLAGST